MTPDWIDWPVFLVRVLFSALAGAACLATCRMARQAWAPLGTIVGLGVLVRAWTGLLLYIIAYYRLPVLTSLQMGDGFWHIAPDARWYYELAASTPNALAIPASAPSPAFLEMLRLWMRIAGAGLASPVLFNLLLYCGMVAMLVAAFGSPRSTAARRGALVSVSAFSFSPVLILLGTQALKDVFFAFVVVCVAMVMFLLLPALGGRTRLRDIVFWAGIAAVAVFLIAGVRPYYAGFTCAAVAVGTVAQGWGRPWRFGLRVICTGAPLIALLWCAFALGAGPSYAPFGRLVFRVVGANAPATAGLPAGASATEAAGGWVRGLRRGFEQSGGKTNLASTSAGPQKGLDRLLDGMATLLVPISLLRALSLVEFSGGRGFLAATDVDTIVMDLTLIGVGWVLLSYRDATRRHAPFICFGLALSLVSALLMAYVVTNYGTLFRLRLLAAVPFWTLPLALAGHSIWQPAAPPIAARPAESRSGRPPAGVD